MSANPIRKEALATLKRLEKKDPGLTQLLDDAYAYAVFPSVGKAAVVIGGAYGKGAVFKQDKMVGYATIGQTTIGVQVGGDTFSEVIAFESKEAFDRFKKGKLAFAANASAVLVKAGAAATADYEKGVSVFAYSSGGMLLEAAIGGQKFKFKPLEEGKDEERSGGQAQESKAGGRGRQSSEEEDEGDDQEGEGQGLFGRAGGGVLNAATKATDFAKEHPVVATLVGMGVIGGLALLAKRTLGSGQQGQSDEDEEQDDSESGDEGGAVDQSDESSEEEDQGEDYSDEDQSDENEDDESDDAEGEEAASGRRWRARA